MSSLGLLITAGILIILGSIFVAGGIQANYQASSAYDCSKPFCNRGAMFGAQAVSSSYYEIGALFIVVGVIVFFIALIKASFL